MTRRLFIAGAAILTVVSLSAQQRAPQNDSIHADELRADLFFLAGDAMRGRLTDTVENRATADYIRSSASASSPPRRATRISRITT